jgi:hypothetical protein
MSALVPVILGGFIAVSNKKELNFKSHYACMQKEESRDRSDCFTQRRT